MASTALVGAQLNNIEIDLVLRHLPVSISKKYLKIQNSKLKRGSGLNCLLPLFLRYIH